MSKTQPNTIPSKKLAKTLKQSDLVLFVNNLNTWPLNNDNDNLLQVSDFGDRLFAVLRNNLNSVLEIIELDPATLDFNNNSIDILKRGMEFNGDIVTENPLLKRDWIAGKGTIVELGTDVPQFFKFYVNAEDDINFTGDDNFEKPITSNIAQVVLAANFTFVSATKRIVDNDTNGILGTMGQVGQVINVTGTASNNSTFTIVSNIDVDTIEVEEVLINETISATITLPSQELTEFEDDEYVNKKYTLATFLKKAGDIMSGILNMAGNAIINVVSLSGLATPTSGELDKAANVDYVNDIAFNGAPNASETVKGIVEIATQTEFDNGDDIGDTLAQLVIKPSQLKARLDAGFINPSAKVKLSVDYSPSGTGSDILIDWDTVDFDANSMWKQGGSTVYDVGSSFAREDMTATTVWLAQSFTTDAITGSLESITMDFSLVGGSASDVISIHIRDSLTGANLYSETGINITSTSTTVVIKPNIPVKASTQYFVVVEPTTVDNVGWLNDGTANTEPGESSHKSTNSGGSWVELNSGTKDMDMTVVTGQGFAVPSDGKYLVIINLAPDSNQDKTVKIISTSGVEFVYKVGTTASSNGIGIAITTMLDLVSGDGITSTLLVGDNSPDTISKDGSSFELLKVSE